MGNAPVDRQRRSFVSIPGEALLGFARKLVASDPEFGGVEDAPWPFGATAATHRPASEFAYSTVPQLRV